MGTGIWIAIVAAAVAVLALAIVLVMRRRAAMAKMTVTLSGLAVIPVAGRHEWYVDALAHFLNVGQSRLTIMAVWCDVAKPHLSRLEAKRVLGDAETHHHLQLHPPDIALRLPIVIDPGRPVNFRFHIFFSAHIRQMWDGGVLRLCVRTRDGAVCEAHHPLIPPAEAAS